LESGRYFDLELALTIKRSIIAASTFVALSTLVATVSVVAPPLPAAAATPTTPNALKAALLTTAFANKAGFPKVVEAATSSSKTGEPSCPDGAQEAFEAASGKTGVIAELVACSTQKAAAALLSGVKAGSSAVAVAPPKQLGSSALERSSANSTYAIYWQRGKVLALVGLATDVPASNSSTTSTTITAPPITSAQQKLLTRAALAQDSRLH
jgi:hypothetical protein